MSAVAARTRADAVRNRARVIAAAAEVCAERGEEASVPEIAARAGVGKGTIYRCFPTKDHLLAAVATDRIRWFAAEARAAAAADDAWGAFRALMDRVADAHCCDRGMVGSISQRIDLPEIAAARADAHDAIAELMQRAIDQGAMRPDASADDFKLLISGIGRALSAAGEDDPDVWRRSVGFVADALRA